MHPLFESILRASFYGSIVIAVVLVLRLVLKKAPKAAVCLLWALALVRLLCPFTIESSLSLQPSLEPAVQAQAGSINTPSTNPINPTPNVPAIPNDNELPDDVVIQITNDAVTDGNHKVIDYGAIAAWVWLAGVVLMAAYGIISCTQLHRRLRGSIPMDGYQENSAIDTAFILGFLKPIIYLPVGLTEACRSHVLAHERAHIARKDHQFKLLAFIALAIHWFNPLVWIGYVLLCRDMEMACDQKVVKSMDVEARKRYSAALLQCSTGHATTNICPVAFAEVSVKQRIVRVLNYRKSGFWITLAAVIALIFVGVCFLTSPQAPSSPTDDQSVPDWGLSCSIDNLTTASCNFVFTQSGSLTTQTGTGAIVKARLYTGRHYWLEGYGDTGWYKLPTLTDPVPWTTEAYGIASNDTTTFNINWSNLYGELPAGRYRIGKTISGPDGNGGQTTHSCYAEFTISDDTKDDTQLRGSTGSEDKAGWGLSLQAKNLTPSSCRLVFTQAGGLTYQDDSGAILEAELTTDDSFLVQALGSSGWFNLTRISKDLHSKFLYTLPLNDSLEIYVNWEEIYDRLPVGRYRIGVPVCGPGIYGTYFTHYYFAEFEITDSTLADAELLETCRLAIAQFQRQETYHLVTQDTLTPPSGAMTGTEQEYWKDDLDWLIHSTPLNTDMYTYRMEKDGVPYAKTDGRWNQVEATQIEEPAAWLLDLQWNDKSITLVEQDAAMGQRMVVLQVDDPVGIADVGAANFYTLTLYLDRDGKLESAEKAADLSGTSYKSVVSILNDTPESVAPTINDAARNIVG